MHSKVLSGKLRIARFVYIVAVRSLTLSFVLFSFFFMSSPYFDLYLSSHKLTGVLSHVPDKSRA